MNKSAPRPAPAFLNLSDVPTAELEARVVEVGESLAVIRAQLESARAKTQETGIYADPRWYNKARHALRMKGQEHQALQRELGKRKKEATQTKASSREQRFVEVCKRRLDAELVKDLWREVDEEESSV